MKTGKSKEKCLQLNFTSNGREKCNLYGEWQRIPILLKKRLSILCLPRLKIQNHSSEIQAALAIHGFAICGFDYSRFRFNNLNLLSAGFSLDYSQIFVLLASNMCLFVENSAPLLSAVLVFAVLSKNVTPANNEGRL